MVLGEELQQKLSKKFELTLKRDREGNIFKDHWELKGKAT
jgi:hypothetical protein